MDVRAVKAIVGDTPHMSAEQAGRITTFMREHDLHEVLELGFKWGVSTCYMAGALEDMEGGHITTIDLERMRDPSLNVDILLDRCGLAEYATVFYEPTSYTWRLMKMLEDDPPPSFDFCFLDAGHTWAVDGFGYFLVDRLLKAGGWIVFDDLDWSFAESSVKDTDLYRSMPQEEQTTKQVRQVFELLVKPHGGYEEFRDEGGWGYARKSLTRAGETRVVREVVVEREKYGLGEFAERAVQRVTRRLRR